MEGPETLSAEIVESIDRQYQPFPSFNEWAASHIDDNLWDETKGFLGTARAALTGAEFEVAHEKVMRAAALTTGAIEGLYKADRGFTITVAEQASAWQQEIEKRGPLAFNLFEAQMEAYESALDVATQRTPISQVWIRSVHEVLTAPQETYSVRTSAGLQEQPLPRGRYKPYPNHVALPDGSFHAYAPVGDTQAEMTRLIDELNSPAFIEGHPVLQCSYAHYTLVAVHPFADGNGRVARALASIWLLRALSIPLVIFTEDKEPYLQSLMDADEGDLQNFVDFILDHAVDSVMLTLEMIDRAKVPEVQKSVAGLQSLLVFRDDIDHEQMDHFVDVLVDALSIEVIKVTGEFTLPNGVNFSAGVSNPSGYRGPPIAGFRAQGGRTLRCLQMSLSIPHFSDSYIYSQIWGFVSTNRNDAFPLALGIEGRAVMRFRISEVRNGITVAGRLRLRSLAEQLLSEMVSSVEDKARKELEQAGYEFDE